MSDEAVGILQNMIDALDTEREGMYGFRIVIGNQEDFESAVRDARDYLDNHYANKY